jgi:hypothetical protein
VVLYHEDGTRAFARPLWLIVVGPRRGELTLENIYAAYAARVDIVHFFRFGKQKLLLTASQTPETEREERWWHIVHLAYVMLWMARHLAQHLPRPWEAYLPAAKQQEISPTLGRSKKTSLPKAGSFPRKKHQVWEVLISYF